MKRITSAHEMNIPSAVFLSAWPEWYMESIRSLKGRCVYCGKTLPKRKRSYCDWECKIMASCASSDLRVTSLRRYIHRWFKFECQDCGKHFSFTTPAGAELPVHAGEVHHIYPLEFGGIDAFENLILLCGTCHKKRHKKHEVKS